MNCSRILVKNSCYAALLILWGCANPVAPDGGPKDTRPPKVMGFDPPDNSVNFKENSIKIDFNEFIVLKNQATELNISPPLKHVPDLRLRGKSLVIAADKFPTNARKDFMIKANKTAKFDKVTEKIIARLRAASPDIVIT